MASLDWCSGFRIRHQTLTLPVAGLSASRAEVFNEARIQHYFEELKVLFGYPTLLYNCDETGMSSVPNSTTKVLAKKGARSVQKL
jgi:hypothetical protein